MTKSMGFRWEVPWGLLANNFVGFHESLLFERHRRPNVYLHYADDIFPLFDSNDDAEAFLIQLNSLQFILVVESGHLLPFLNILVDRKKGSFNTLHI